MLQLAVPTILMYFGIMLMGIVDLLVLSHLGTSFAAAGGTSHSIFAWVMMAGIGIIYGMDYPTSSAVGAGDPKKAFHYYLQGLYLSLITSAVCQVLLTYMIHSVERFGMNSEVTPMIQEYLKITQWGLFPCLAFNACRSYLTSQGKGMEQFATLVASNVVNLLLAYGMVFGEFGFEQRGFVGAAWATTYARWFMFLFLFIWIWYNDQNQENYFKQAIEFKTWKFDLKAILQMVKLGVPSSVQNMFEVGAFSFASTLVARLSSEAAAANQFVLNVASTTFMFPLGLSVAVGSLVGQRMGANDVDGALKMGRKGFKVTVAMMGFFGVLLYLFPTQIMGFYTKDLKVIELSLQVVVLVSLFQIFDGLQVVATGALRGTGNTLISALINCLGHWGVGVPLGYYLCFVQGRGLLGVWTGLAIGLMVVAIALLVAWRWRSRVLLRTRSL